MSNDDKIEFYLEESSIISFKNLIKNINHIPSRNRKEIGSQLSTNDKTPNKLNFDNCKKEINEDENNENNNKTFNLKINPKNSDGTLSLNQIYFSFNNNINQINDKSKKII